MKKPKHKMMKHDDEAQDRALFKKMEAEEGPEPGMKRGGRTKKMARMPMSAPPMQPMPAPEEPMPSMQPGMKRGGRSGGRSSNQYARGGKVGSGDWYD